MRAVADLLQALKRPKRQPRVRIRRLRQPRRAAIYRTTSLNQQLQLVQHIVDTGENCN